ncbi:hypothetical protein ACYOEI_08065 [Singulisphaera rosea]
MDNEFKLFPAGMLRAMLGLTAENRPTIVLDPAKVPPSLRHLIPPAERFGVSDDLIRLDIVEKTSAEDLDALKHAVSAHDDAFDEWLAGPEADSSPPPEEYLAFTCLRMVADEV